MKKWKIVLLAILAVLILLISIFIYKQRNNISAVVTSVTKSEEEIAVKLNDSKKKLETELKEKYSTEVIDLTAEEEKKIMTGQLSVDEAVSVLNKKYEESKKGKDNSSEIDRLIGDKAIELYSLKAYYLGQLAQMEATVKQEYASLPQEKRNLVGVKEIADKHMGTVLSWLNQCDNQVAVLLSELEAGLKKNNADTSIIKTIQDTYENEKMLKKAYYLKILEG